MKHYYNPRRNTLTVEFRNNAKITMVLGDWTRPRFGIRAIVLQNERKHPTKVDVMIDALVDCYGPGRCPIPPEVLVTAKLQGPEYHALVQVHTPEAAPKTWAEYFKQVLSWILSRKTS